MRLILAGMFLASLCGAQSLAPGGLSPGDMPWLQLNCHKATGAKFTPNWTVIVSSIEPSVTKIRENRWEISFKH